MRKHIREFGNRYRLEDTELNRLKQFRGEHPGLTLHRFLAEQLPPEDATSQQAKEQKKLALAERQALLQSAINAASDTEVCALYKIAFDRWQKSLPELTAANDLQTVGRLIVGLGTENVLETGIRLHHTYGMPILPGSALKGLAAHYCDQVWGERDNPNPSEDAMKFRGPRKEDHVNERPPEPQGQYHKLLFGATDDSGCIIFHDAWFVPDSEKEPLKLDVMTPHHSGWNNVEKPEPPTDFDSPVPVPFLSVAGRFLVAVSWCGPPSDEALPWRNLAFDCLRKALFDWGIGGKTTSGYGRFDEQKWEAEEAKQQGEIEQKRILAEKEAALAAMSPMERSIQEVLENHPNKQWPDYMKLLKELENDKGRWTSSDDRKEVAKRIKQGMQAAKKWGKKDKDAERTEYIKRILGES